MKRLIAFQLILCCTVLVSARSKPVKGFTAFLLGVPGKGKAFTNQIPIGESAVYTLAEAENGLVFGGTRVTRGRTPWIFCFDVSKGVVGNEWLWPLDKTIRGQTCVSGLAAGSNGRVYGATSNYTDIDNRLQEEIRAMDYKGGHVFYFPGSPGRFKLTDLGIPFPNEGIGTLVADPKRRCLYGLTVPGQIFFRIDEKTGKIRKLGALEPVEQWRKRYIGKSSRALVLDNRGNVYGGAAGGKMFKYNVKQKKIEVLEALLPTEVSGRNFDGITALIRTKQGRIFGGTFLDGKLFEFLPATGRLKPLGITCRTGHLRGMAEKDGVLYGFSGSEKAVSRLFAYNLKTGEHRAFPDITVYFHNDPDKYKWVPYQVKDFILVKSGLFVLGENSSNGKVFTYKPEISDWNP